MSKYRAVKTECEGIVFDSKKEAHRYQELRICERAGIITNLERQVPFDLFGCKLNEKQPVKIARYIADFTYQDQQGRTIIEDTKGFKTRDYLLKKKLFEACYNLRITET